MNSFSNGFYTAEHIGEGIALRRTPRIGAYASKKASHQIDDQLDFLNDQIVNLGKPATLVSDKDLRRAVTFDTKFISGVLFINPNSSGNMPDKLPLPALSTSARSKS